MPDEFSQTSERAAVAATPEPAREQASKSQSAADKLPLLPLAAAGLSVFNGIIAVGFLALWLIDGNSALGVIQTLAGLSILLGLAAIVVGSLILNNNRRSESTMPGSNWAKVSVIAGLFLLGVTVMLPLISALQVLVGSGL